MKNKITTLTLALAICALVGTLALAKGKPHTLTFNEDTLVNGTLVKKGEYRAKFDQDTGQLTIMETDNDVVVTAKATEQSLDKKVENTTFETTHNESGIAMLKSVTFHGKRVNIVLDDAGNQTIGEEYIEIFSEIW